MEAEEVEINEDSSEESEELEEIEDPYEEFEEIDDFTENDGWPVELELPAKNAKKEEKSFEILETTEAVLEDAYKKIIEVQQIICLPSMISTRAALNHYKWNTQRLIEDFYNEGSESVLNKINMENILKIIPKEQSNRNNATEEDCQICFSESNPDMLYGLSCGHKYCRTCWNQFLTGHIGNTENEIFTCPEVGCDQPVDDEDVIKLVMNSNVISMYQQRICSSVVKHNDSLRWCASPFGCEHVIKKIRPDTTFCVCSCKYEFCFDCSSYWHVPVTCAQLKKWNSSNESETFKFITNNFQLMKPCPRPGCDIVIEKDGGCNHMICRDCKYEFCWICLRNWNGHKPCNRYDEFEARENNNSIVARFQHFYNRYMSQINSIEFLARRYRKGLNKEIEDLKEKHSLTDNELQFVRDAIRVLFHCRRTLAYTFVFAYYLAKNNQVEIFEDNQQHLQEDTERLEDYLNIILVPPSYEHPYEEFKEHILDIYPYCEQRIKALLDHIEDAKKHNLWEMDESL